MLLEVFRMCEVDKIDLATELQLFFPSPLNLPVQDNHEKQDHLIDCFNFIRLKF